MTTAVDIPSYEYAPQEMFQLLRDDGEVVGDLPAIADTDLVEMLRWMKVGRALDAKSISLQRQGKTATYAPGSGQEAALVGSAWALDHEHDWVFWQYREAITNAIHGLPLLHMFLYLRSHPAGMEIPKGVNVFPIQIGIASQIPHGVGFAWGLKMQNKPGAVVTYFGDGSTSEGAFHEACNFAGVFEVPVVLFCQNNQYAISTPRRKQSAGETIAQRAIGYGFPGVQVDGNDVFAVYQATKEALDRARGGGGPTLIEAVTYRFGSHTTADDATRYRPAEEYEAALKRDPIDRLRIYLERRELWTKADEDKADADAAQLVQEQADLAEVRGFAGPEDLFDHVFAELTPQLREQRAAALGEQ